MVVHEVVHWVHLVVRRIHLVVHWISLIVHWIYLVIRWRHLVVLIACLGGEKLFREHKHLLRPKMTAQGWI